MAPKTLSPPAGRRGGFTLVELLVAAGLSVLVMAILATAFGQGMETLSHLKSTVTLSQQLRGVEAVIRGDLAAPHLEEDGKGVGNTVQVSNRAKIKEGWKFPNKGYFRIDIPTAPGGSTDALFALERADSEGDSYRAVNHRLRFTVRLPGGSPQEVFTARIPLNAAGTASRMPSLMQQSQNNMSDTADNPTLFSGVWAEVSYFLVDTGLTTSNDGSTEVPTPTPLRLYTLHRRVRALAPNAIDQTVDDTSTPPTGEVYPEVSYRPAAGATPAKVNTPATVTDPANTIPTAATAGARAAMPPLSGDSQGADVLLSNVVSMQVLPMLDSNSVPIAGVQPAGATANTFLDYPGSAPWSFDTFDPVRVAGGGTTPRVSLKAVQLKLRVYDVRNRVTRQVTLAQDL